VLWERRFPGTGTQGAAFGAVATDGSTVYVAGSSDTNRRLQDYTTVAYDAATGVQQWRRLYDGGAHNGDGAAAIVVNGGRVFVTGSSLGVGTSLDYATIAYGATDGHRLWVERFDDQSGGTDEAFAIVAAPDGSDVFVTGNAAGHDETIAYDARDGTERWARDLRRRIGHRSGFATEAIAPTGRRC
jgi:outer membrane protein assembly factor BamB